MSTPDPPTGLRERLRSDGALEWVLDAPERRNAISPDVLRHIARRCTALCGEIVVLRGAGPGFCAGFDLTALVGATYDPAALPDAALVAATSAMRTAEATFVGAVHGFAIGAGVELVCACDIRIASDDATFRVPAAALGVVYHADGVVRLREVFGAAATARLLLLGDRLDAAEAEAAGALCRRVAARELDATVDDVVARLSGVDRTSLAANRDLLRALVRGPLDATTQSEHERARREAYARIDPLRVRPAKA